MAGDDVHFTAHQHRLAQGRIHVHPRHRGRIDPDLGGEGGKELVGGVEHRCPEFAAHEVLGLFDAALLERVEPEGRRVVDHEHGLGCLTGIGDVELDQGVDVGEAHLIGAGGDPLDRSGRSGAPIDRHPQPGLVEIAQLAGGDERRGGPLKGPIERELDVHGGGPAAVEESQRCERGGRDPRPHARLPSRCGGRCPGGSETLRTVR